MRTVCSKCEKPVVGRGLCGTHYAWARRNGTLPELPTRPTICAIAECGRAVRKLGWCTMHYQRWRAHGDALWKPAPPAAACKVDGCESRGASLGWCFKHYNRWSRHGDPNWIPVVGPTVCTVPACERPVISRGWCVMHYSRWLSAGDPEIGGRPSWPAICTEEDCDSPSLTRGFCAKHYARVARRGSPDALIRDRHRNGAGYQVVKREGHPIARPSGWVYEHRVVLFDHIGPGWHPCHWCGTAVSWDATYPRSLTALVVDHVDDDKTNNVVGNLVPSCAPCNLSRSSGRAAAR